MSSTRAREAAERFAERRRREDDAPRLREKVPRLRSLRLEIEERRATSASAENKHVRLIVVDRAPALFVIPCGDSLCQDGGHDVTHALVQALVRGEPQVEIEDSCYGQVGSSTCGRIVRVVAKPTYGE